MTKLTTDDDEKFRSMTPNAKALLLFWVYFKTVLIVVGGGYAIIPVIKSELINRYKMITDDDLLDMMAVIQSVPGLIAVNSAGYIGFRIAGIRGAAMAIIGATIPPVVAITIIAALLGKLNETPQFLEKAFIGVRAAVSALVAQTAVKLFRKTLSTPLAIVIFACSLPALIWYKVAPGYIIVTSAVLGIVCAVYSDWKNKNNQVEPEQKS